MQVLTSSWLDKLAHTAARLAGTGVLGWNSYVRIIRLKQLAGFLVATHMAQDAAVSPTGQPGFARSLAAIMPDTKPLELPCETQLASAGLCTSIKLHMPSGQRPSWVQALAFVGPKRWYGIRLLYRIDFMYLVHSPGSPHPAGLLHQRHRLQNSGASPLCSTRWGARQQAQLHLRDSRKCVQHSARDER
jgi:hypothetical protein